MAHNRFQIWAQGQIKRCQVRENNLSCSQVFLSTISPKFSHIFLTEMWNWLLLLIIYFSLVVGGGWFGGCVGVFQLLLLHFTFGCFLLLFLLLHFTFSKKLTTAQSKSVTNILFWAVYCWLIMSWFRYLRSLPFYRACLVGVAPWLEHRIPDTNVSSLTPCMEKQFFMSFE